MKTFLMCEPTYFGVSYDINPWMTGNLNNVNREKAAEQFNNLVEKIYELGANVKFVEPHPDFPDQVFTANAGLIVDDETAVVSRFRYKERQGEELIFEQAFKELGYNTVQPALGKGHYFEGAGDALRGRFDSTLFVGYGHRTDREYADALATYAFGLNVMPLKLIDPRYYHLDTCFCPLDGGHLLMNLQAFDSASLVRLNDVYKTKHIAFVSQESAAMFACNAVSIGKDIILNDITKEDEAQLNEFGYTVHRVDLSEFMKAGGSAKCLTLHIKN